MNLFLHSLCPLNGALSTIYAGILATQASPFKGLAALFSPPSTFALALAAASLAASAAFSAAILSAFY